MVHVGIPGLLPGSGRRSRRDGGTAGHTSKSTRGPSHAPEAVMGHHQALAGARSGAVAMAGIDPDQQRVLDCAIGNIAGAIITPSPRTSCPGALGASATNCPPCAPPPTSCRPAAHQSCIPDDPPPRRDPRNLPGLPQHTPPVIAGHLLRSAGKYHDNAFVLVTRGTR